MNKAKILVSHDIGLHNSAITLKECPECKEGELLLNGESLPKLLQIPELVVSGAIGNVADEELLGVPPALPLVVAQLNLKEKPLQMLSM